MRARATISFISRTLALTVLRANEKKMGFALFFFALDCTSQLDMSQLSARAEES